MRHRLKSPTSRLHTYESALALHKLLSPIKLEAQYPKIGKPYHLAHSSINALAITEPLSNTKSTDNGSISFQWWARQERIRTLAELPLKVNFRQVQN